MKIVKKNFKDCYSLWSRFQSLLNHEMDKVANFPCDEEEDLAGLYWKRIKQGQSFVLFAYEDNIPVGMICYREQKKRIDIRDFYVLPEYRNKGIGKKLLSEVVKIRNNRILYVGTVGGNERVLKLYQEFGFKILGYELQRS